jgi:hypothetical protein
MANFVAQSLSPAAFERLNKGRKAYESHISKIVGGDARIRAAPESITDMAAGVYYDRFTVQTLRPLTSEKRALLNGLGSNVVVGNACITVDIDRARYDPRWLAIDWTAQQRTLGVLMLVFALAILAASAWFEHYRVTVLKGEPVVGNATYDLFSQPMSNITSQLVEKITNAIASFTSTNATK